MTASSIAELENRVYQLDIETDTTINGLDPNVARITEIAVSGRDFGHVFNDPDERRLLSDTIELLDSLPPGIILDWNGSVFDFPFICTRAGQITANGPIAPTGTVIPTGIRMRYDPDLPVKYQPTLGWSGGYRIRIGAHQHLDISRFYREKAAELGVKHSLKPVHKAITGRTPIELNRARMHDYSRQQRREYALSDTVLTGDLGLLLGVTFLFANADVLD